MVVGVLGIAIGSLNGTLSIQSPAFSTANFFTSNGTTPPMLPVLFITIACGACSGFHSIVASGTTSKQLNNEKDTRAIGYGSMLLEAFLACISLATVMILAKPTGRPDLTYADGIAIFMNQASFGAIPVAVARQFGLLCFATFVFDTLDACTRLARFVVMEFTGWKSRVGLYGATAFSVIIPALVLAMPPAVVNGAAVPFWKIFWGLFGSSNQLLAALALLGVTVWLARRGRTPWLTLGPSIFMLAMTIWSLGNTIAQRSAIFTAADAQPAHKMEFWVAAVLVVMALWLVVESLLLARRHTGAPQRAS